MLDGAEVVHGIGGDRREIKLLKLQGSAFIETRERKQILEGVRAVRPAAWAVNKRRLDQALRDYEEMGVCFGIGDWRREVNAVAAPLVPPDGSGPIVIGCSGAAFQLSPDLLRREVGPRLLAMVGNVRATLASG